MEDEASAPKLAWGGAGLLTGSQNDNKNVQTPSFQDVMSEHVAVELQNKFDAESSNHLEQDIGLLQDLKLSDKETSDDFLLAQMLQYDYDKEFDQQLDREEKHVNKNSKLGVSYDKYKVCPAWYGQNNDEMVPDIDDEGRSIDSFEEHEKNDPAIPPCGYVKHNDVMVSKHDTNISARKNAKRVMNFPPGFNTGDAGGFDMKLSNRVYNNLHKSAISDSKRKQRTHDKMDNATANLALDSQTKNVLFKLVNTDVIESVGGMISTGKESVVFHAHGGKFEDRQLPAEIVLKIFKTTLTHFKNREMYIKEDYRFKDRMSKNSNKGAIELWAEKEFHNLRRLHKANVASPEPLLIKKHVLLMTFIGEEGAAAPQLRNVRMPLADWGIVYEQVTQAMTEMFRTCNLIHADLSEYNILWYKDQCWFIDLGQAVEPIHPSALHFLFRDCTNVLKFFRSKKLTDLPTPILLFEQITQINLPKNGFSNGLVEYEMSKDTWEESRSTNEDFFDYFWKELQKKKTNTHQQADDSAEEDLSAKTLSDHGEHEPKKSPRTRKSGRKKRQKEI